MSKVFLLLGAIFATLGLIAVGIGLWFYSESSAIADGGVNTRGTVIEMVRSRDSDGDVTYRPVVEFRDAEGTRREFTGRFGSSPPSYSTGESVSVIYDPDAPGRAIIDGFVGRYLFPLVFGGIGTIFAATGIGFLYFYFRRRRIVAELRANGLPIQAEFVETYRDTRTKLNGRSPYRVVCQATHPATGRLHSFKSDAIWVDPSEAIGASDIRVLVDPARPKHYWVDLSRWVDDDAT